MGEGWDSMVNIRKVEDNIMEVDDKEVMGKGLMKIGVGQWDFKFNLEDWPTPEGWNREEKMTEICKGLKWVWGKVVREWSVEEIIGWERYWEGREDMYMEVSKRDGNDDNENNNNNDKDTKESDSDKENDKDKNKSNNKDDGAKRDGVYNDNKEKDGDNKKERNKKRSRRSQRKGVRGNTVCVGEGEPSPAMRWEARRQRGKNILGAEDEAPRKEGSDSLHWTPVEGVSASLSELEWDGLDRRYVKKKRKRIEVGVASGASTKLANGASTKKSLCGFSWKHQ